MDHYHSLPCLEDIKRTADLCVKCNICTSACPVVPGHGPVPRAEVRRAAGAAVPRSRLAVARPLAGLLLGLRRSARWSARTACKVMEINTAAKAELRKRNLQKNPLDPKMVRNWLLGRNEVLGQVGGLVAPLANLVLGFRPVRLADGKDARHRSPGAVPDVPLPQVPRLVLRRSTSARRRRRPPGAPKVAYFHGCATNHYEHGGRQGDRRRARAQRLRGACCPTRTAAACRCSRTATSTAPGAMRMANLKKLAPYVEQDIPIVVGGTSCGLELKSDYRELLGIHTPEAKAAGRARLRHQRVPVAAARGRAAQDRLRDLRRPLHALPHLLPPEAAPHRPARARPAGPGARPDRRGAWASTAAASPAPTATSTRSTRSPRRWAGRCSRSSRHPARRLPICDNETCRWNIAASSGLTCRAHGAGARRGVWAPLSRSVLIVGAGAVGCFVGARLALSGAGVTLVGRGGLVEAARSSGLLLSEPEGERRTPPLAAFTSLGRGVRGGEYDLAILTVKAYDTAVVIAEMASASDAAAARARLQNGVGNEDALARSAG